jgi:hypothetical protein
LSKTLETALTKALPTAALAVWMLAPCHGQSLLHRYSFNGNANDSVGTAHGAVVGSVSIVPAWGANGTAIFTGGTSSSGPGYIRLPVTAVSGLQNATIEIFTANFSTPLDVYGQAGGYFQALFSVAGAYGSLTNYSILSPNRSGAGIGLGTRSDGAAENVIVSPDPLPVSYGNHVVHLVFSGFGGIGATGVAAVYLDGVKVAQGATVYSFAKVAAGAGGISVVGIGGGSPFNDPTFRGSMSEVRIYNGALNAAQIAANVAMGPGALGFTPPYTLAEAARAAQIAGGVGAAATSWEKTRLNVEIGGGSATAIDLLDALRIARRATGLESNP